jgi:hypothetical protein
MSLLRLAPCDYFLPAMFRDDVQGKPPLPALRRKRGTLYRRLG